MGKSNTRIFGNCSIVFHDGFVIVNCIETGEDYEVVIEMPVYGNSEPIFKNWYAKVRVRNKTKCWDSEEFSISMNSEEYGVDQLLAERACYAIKEANEKQN